MTMNDKIAHFAENYGNAFFVESLTNKKTIYVNKTARELFAITAETCDFKKIFSYSNEELYTTIVEHFSNMGQTFLQECRVRTAEGSDLKIDLQIGYFDADHTEIYLEMILRKENSKAMSEFQVDKSLKAEAILELDDKLTISYKNTKFEELFGCLQEDCQEVFAKHYEGALINAFPIHQRGNILSSMKVALEKSETYHLEQEITKTCGEKIWISMDVQKRRMDREGNEKLMATFANVSNRKQIENKNTIMQQQFAALQELTSDILYHIDVEQGLLYHDVHLVRLQENLNPIADYINVFVKNKIVFPADVKKYMNFLKDWYVKSDSNEECTIRASVLTMEYQWYTVRNKKIFDESGKLAYVVGALVNVQELYNVEEKFSNLNKYFDVLQSISGESYYSVDVKNKTLMQQGQVAQELGFPPGEMVTHFPESVLYKVHPHDVEAYKGFTTDSMNGLPGEMQVRVMTAQGDYQWYAIVCDVIFDDKGEVSEVVGKMNNIQNEKSLEQENSYFQAVQSLSEEAHYSVDIKTKILSAQGISITELGLSGTVAGYPEAVYHLVHPDDLENYKAFADHAFQGLDSTFKVRLKNTDRAYCWYELNCTVLRDEQEEPTEIIGNIKNIQKQVELEQKATHDLMTKVLNKVSFEEAASQVLSGSMPEEKHALIFIDLDDFKGINDNLGHTFGDFLLTTVGKRLKRVVREKDLIGRLGGDEFAVMLKSIGSVNAAELRVKLLLDTLQRTFSFDGKSIGIKASLGISVFPDHGETYSELIKKSDIALYVSKEKGKNVATLYSHTLNENRGE